MLFFELLQVALGNRDRLGTVPSAKEWMEIYAESERQAVTGILLHGIDRLPAEQRPSQAFLLQWIGVGQMIEQRNHLMDECCRKLLRKLAEQGLYGTILKGQGIAQLYYKDLQPLRQSGDIDVYVTCGLKKALEFAAYLKQKENEWDYKHLHLHIWNDTEVEMHYRVEVLLNLWKNRKLQKWFKDNNGLLYIEINGITTPTILINVFYILLHIYRHFLYKGVGMRQIVDYYMVLKTVHDNRINTDISLKAVSRFGMNRFAKGLMWLMHETLGMPKEWILWAPDEKEGRFILGEVLTGGSFGYHDQRLTHGGGKWNTVKQVCKHNWHLLSHYPADVIWAPIWFVWHKCWKLKTKALLVKKEN